MPRGTILFVQNRPDSFDFGFIAPDGENTRDENVYFNSRALGGEVVKGGDRVEYELFKAKYPSERGPSATRVMLLDDHRRITTHGGENDFY